MAMATLIVYTVSFYVRVLHGTCACGNSSPLAGLVNPVTHPCMYNASPYLLDDLDGKILSQSVQGD